MDIKNTSNFNQQSLKMIVFGQSGAGKTFLAKTIKEKTLILSAESGLLSLVGEKIDYVEVKTIRDLEEVYAFIMRDQGKTYQWVYIDSISEISDTLLANLKVEFVGSKDTFKVWDKYGEKLLSMIKSFRDIPFVNVVFTARQAMKDNSAGIKQTTADLSGKVGANISHYFDEVFYLFVQEENGTRVRKLLTGEHRNIIAKDRSGRLDLFEKPDLDYIKAKIFKKNEIKTEIKNELPKQEEKKK